MIITVLSGSPQGDDSVTLAGYDLEFTKAIADVVTVPIVASGGASVLLVASVFHFRTFSIRQVKEYLRERGLNVSL